jgi:uncharacterized membrane protein
VETLLLHPPLSAFPVALITVIVLLEAARFFLKWEGISSAIKINLVLAAAMLLAAFFSGYQASDYADGTFKIPDDAIAEHHKFGKILLFTFLPCVMLRFIESRAMHGKKIFHWTYLAFLAASFLILIQTGYLGGKLVFKLGAGVRAEK